MKHGLLSLIVIVVLAVGGLGGTLAAGNEPLLGLDLQGGVSVVLQPTKDAESEAIGQAIQIIRQRVDGLGVAEPEISRQGDSIIVQLPGVKDRDRALELVGQTAELRFRPVISVLPPQFGDILADPEGVGDESTPDDDTDESTPDDTDDSTPDDTVVDDGADEAGYGLTEGEFAAPFQAGDDSDETEDPDPAVADEGDQPAADEGNEPAADEAPPGAIDPAELEALAGLGNLDFSTLGDDGLTTPDGDEAEATVVLAQYEDGVEVGRFQLGPTEATGEILTGARADLQGLGTWFVSVDIAGSRLGDFNRIASTCFNRQSTCPTGRLAIVLDGEVVSAPNINDPVFESTNLSITGQFTESEAKDLALILRYGSLPVELEAQQTQSVSATIGKDSLDAGVTAGLVGLFLVAIYMISYYRLLGVVAMLSLAISAALLWTMIAFLGESQGLALTLAGVTGIIVSIGVAVDSNVVFYEHLKEDVSNGRTLRSAVDGSFASAFSTIVKADVASLIGAGILYMLTVGPVRGFALYLGIATILDLVASYFFMRPAVRLLVRSKRLEGKRRAFGMPKLASTTETEVPA